MSVCLRRKPKGRDDQGGALCLAMLDFVCSHRAMFGPACTIGVRTALRPVPAATAHDVCGRAARLDLAMGLACARSHCGQISGAAARSRSGGNPCFCGSHEAADRPKVTEFNAAFCGPRRLPGCCIAPGRTGLARPQAQIDCRAAPHSLTLTP